MTQTAQTSSRLGAGMASPGVPSRAALIGIAAVLATATNAVAFMFPPLLPLIETDYTHGSVNAATWVFTVLTLASGAGFVLIPRLTDIRSDRSISLLSGGCLTVGALIPAVVSSYPALLIGSALLGFGGAAQLVPLSFLRRHLAGDAVATAVSVLIMATGTGVVLGMVGGGLSVKYLSVTAFFYILAAIFVATTVGLLAIVPNSPPEFAGRIAISGTVGLIGWVTVILLALTAPALGDTADLLLLVGIAAAAWWARVERRSDAPVFDLKLLKQPFVTTACLSAGLFGCVDAAFLVLVSYYTQNPKYAGYGLGMDALGTSLVMLPFALTMFISGKAAEKVVQRGRPGLVLVVGAVICAVGLLFLAAAHDHAWQYVVGSAIVGLGSRAGYSGAFAVPQLVVPEDRAGMAAGMPGTVMAIGFAFGSAVITSLQLASTITVENPAAPPATLAFPAAHVYTDGYYVTLLFPVLVVVATLVSRRRNPNGFTLLLEGAV